MGSVGARIRTGPGRPCGLQRPPSAGRWQGRAGRVSGQAVCPPPAVKPSIASAPNRVGADAIRRAHWQLRATSACDMGSASNAGTSVSPLPRTRPCHPTIRQLRIAPPSIPVTPPGGCSTPTPPCAGGSCATYVGAPADAVAAERRTRGDRGLGCPAARPSTRRTASGATGRDAVLGGPHHYSLVLDLCDLGLDPSSEQARAPPSRRVRDHITWGPEFGNSPFFDGEVEPCINGRVVALGAYFGVRSDTLVDRLLGEQLADGGWNCEAERGSLRSSFDTTINVLEGLLMYEAAIGSIAAVAAARTAHEAYLLERRLFRLGESTGRGHQPGLVRSSPFPCAGTTTCCGPSTTCALPVWRPMRARPRPSASCASDARGRDAGCSTCGTATRCTRRCPGRGGRAQSLGHVAGAADAAGRGALSGALRRRSMLHGSMLTAVWW